jgi:hypothetical protein
VTADQRDRDVPVDQTDWDQVLPRDLERRRRVAEIFAEGCFKEARDYSAAALVFQHGDVPDHYLQTFLWSKRAVELGDASQRSLMALGLDRYLVSTGRKQLFASQASAATVGGCYCIQPIERSFPDSKRKDFTGRSIRDAYRWVESLNKGKPCPSVQECGTDLKPSPEGTIPGFWRPAAQAADFFRVCLARISLMRLW